MYLIVLLNRCINARQSLLGCAPIAVRLLHKAQLLPLPLFTNYNRLHQCGRSPAHCHAQGIQLCV